MAIYQQSHFMKGMTYALFWSDLSDPGFLRSLDKLAQTGCEWIALAVGWWQKTGTSTDIYPHPEKTPDDRELEKLIDHIRSLGMKVMLKPFIDSEDHTWRAEFKPASTIDWFRSYEGFISHYARLAHRKQLELLSIGCENVLGNKQRQEYWMDMILLVKQFYQGPLTYSANFDKSVSYKKVLFWDQLDYIGIDAYFSVASWAGSKPKQIIVKWKQLISRIDKWRKSNYPEKKVLFTELGVCSYHGAAVQPWAYPDRVETSESEQRDYYQAFFDAFADCDWLAGVFWWWWDNPSTDDYIERKDRAGSKYAYFYTPQGKPAEEVIRNYFLA